MTPAAARAATLVGALQASIEHDRGAAGDVYTEDMRAWTPAMSTASLSELMGEFERRDDAFSEIELEVSPLDVGRREVVDPTGVRVTLHGITVAEFRGDRICSIRQYWDELSVFDQLGLLRDGDLR